MMKNFIGIAMGVIILIADIGWLLYEQSYTVTAWLAFGIVILIADPVWIGVDASFLMEGRNASKTKPNSETKPNS